MQGPLGSVDNISRLRNNDTNRINGFYKVNEDLKIRRSQRRQLGSSDIGPSGVFALTLGVAAERSVHY
jgi:hypothetical protein